MMDRNQIKVVTDVFNHFMDSEKYGWTGIDDYIALLDWLDEDQIVREAETSLAKLEGVITCDEDHSHSAPNACLAPTVVEAVVAIVELYKESGSLHKNNRYILDYFLALCHIGKIVAKKE